VQDLRNLENKVMNYIRNTNCDNKWIYGLFSAKENFVGFSATDYEKLTAVA